MNDKPIITYIYMGICITFFAFLNIFNHTSIIDLITYGAKTNFMIVDYKFWYLVTPMFMHASISHIATNMISLYFIGPFTESFLGTKKYIMFIFFTGILSTIGSFIFSDYVSLGASGVIFAFLGIHLFLFIEYRERYTELFGTQVLKILALNLVFTFVYNKIDVSGHIFGLLAGMSFMAISNINKNKLKQMLGYAFVVFMLIGFTYKFYTYKYSEDYFQFKGYYLNQTGNTKELNELMKQYEQR